MTTITGPEEISFRAKLGNGGRGFATPDLDRIWVEAGESMTKAILIALEELMVDAARFNDYTQNDTQEKRSQVFDHIAKVLVPYYQKKVDAEVLAANPRNKAARIYGTRVVPPRRVERPYTDSDCDSDGTWR